MKKILIFGAAGMAGHVAAAFLQNTGEYQVIRCARNVSAAAEVGVDVTDSAKVQEVLRQYRPDYVLNCAGMLVAACAARLDRAILVNSYFPNLLAKLGKEWNFRLIHISTDCVFSGQRGGYLEDDFRDGDTPYARTKALGEIVDDRNLTIRTSIVGPELKRDGTGLFHWFMRQHGAIRGYTRAFWSGVTTLELAKAVHAAMRQNLTGLYQLTMPKRISKYELLGLFKEIWKRDDVTIEPYDGYRCDKSLICTRKDFHYPLPASYEAMLQEMKEWMGGTNYIQSGTINVNDFL